MEQLIKLYQDSDVVMGEFLAATKVSEVGDLTFEEAYELYNKATEWDKED